MRQRDAFVQPGFRGHKRMLALVYINWGSITIFIYPLCNGFLIRATVGVTIHRGIK